MKVKTHPVTLTLEASVETWRAIPRWRLKQPSRAFWRLTRNINARRTLRILRCDASRPTSTSRPGGKYD